MNVKSKVNWRGRMRYNKKKVLYCLFFIWKRKKRDGNENKKVIGNPPESLQCFVRWNIFFWIRLLFTDPGRGVRGGSHPDTFGSRPACPPTHYPPGGGRYFDPPRPKILTPPLQKVSKIFRSPAGPGPTHPPGHPPPRGGHFGPKSEKLCLGTQAPPPRGLTFR